VNQTPGQFPLADYLGNLGHLLAALRTTGAKVIWATITPVKVDRRPPRPDARWWDAAELEVYNRAALAMMQGECVAVNDLGALVSPSLKTYIGEDGVHLTELGQRACAAAVAHAIEPHLPGARA
jgi:lysophospholipase L1-like esterase